MSLTTFDATPQKPDGSMQGQEAQSAAAQFLTGEVFGSSESAMGSFASAGTKALQQTLDNNAQDMKLLENQGALPESKNVAAIEDATPADKSANFTNMMQAEANTFQNV